MDITAEQIQVSRLAKFLRYAVTLALAGCAASWLVMTSVFWLGHTELDLGAGLVTLQMGIAGDVSNQPWVLWLLLNVDLAIVGYGLYRLRALLLGYEAGELFSRRAANHLSAFALCMVLREVVDLLAPLVSSGAFHVDTGSLRLVLVGIVFWLLSRVLAAAFTLADDHGRII